MARIRTVKPEFWTSEQISECSTIARLLFIGMWNFCDDAGNHPASLKQLKMQLFPSDDISISEIDEMVKDLLKNDLIAQYTVNNKDYWHVLGWHHQKIDKPTYKHPDYAATNRQQFDDNSSNTRQPLTPVRESKGMEGKGMELNNKNNASDEKNEQAIIDSYRKEQDTRRDFELFVDWKPEPKSWDNQLKASKHIVHPSQFTDYSLCEFIRLNIGKPPKNENGWQKYYISAIAKGFIKSAQVDQPSTNQPYQNQQPQRKVCTMAGYTPEGLKNWDLEPMKNPEDFIPASPEFMEKCREAIRNGGAK
jgi:hypothetical protein